MLVLLCDPATRCTHMSHSHTHSSVHMMSPLGLEAHIPVEHRREKLLSVEEPHNAVPVGMKVELVGKPVDRDGDIHCHSLVERSRRIHSHSRVVQAVSDHCPSDVHLLDGRRCSQIPRFGHLR